MGKRRKPRGKGASEAEPEESSSTPTDVEDWVAPGTADRQTPGDAGERVALLVGENEDLHAELQTVSREVLGLRTKLNDKDSELLELRSKLQQRDRVIAEMQGMQTELERQVNEQKAAAVDALAEVARVHDENAQQATELQSEMNAHERTRTLLATTADERDSARQELAELTTQFMTSQQEAQRLAEDLWAMRSRHGSSIELLDQIRSLCIEYAATEAASGTHQVSGPVEALAQEVGAEVDALEELEEGAPMPMEGPETEAVSVDEGVGAANGPGEDDEPDEPQDENKPTESEDAPEEDEDPDPGATVRERVVILHDDGDGTPNSSPGSLASTLLDDDGLDPLRRLGPLLQQRPAIQNRPHADEMTASVAFMLSQIDGSSSLEDVIDASGLPQDEAAQILVDLLERGVIDTPA